MFQMGRLKKLGQFFYSCKMTAVKAEVTPIGVLKVICPT